jgi:hypothetical protein
MTNATDDIENREILGDWKKTLPEMKTFLKQVDKEFEELRDSGVDEPMKEFYNRILFFLHSKIKEAYELGRKETLRSINHAYIKLPKGKTTTSNPNSKFIFYKSLPPDFIKEEK